MALSLIGVGCGSSDNSLTIRTANATYEANGDRVECVAQYAQGNTIPSADGYSASPVVCTIGFQTNGNLGDILQIEANDVYNIYNNYMNTPLIIDGNTVSAAITIQGQPQPIYRGVVIFRQLTNAPGGRVTADYQIETGIHVVEGHFSGKVSVY